LDLGVVALLVRKSKKGAGGVFSVSQSIAIALSIARYDSSSTSKKSCLPFDTRGHCWGWALRGWCWGVLEVAEGGQYHIPKSIGRRVTVFWPHNPSSGAYYLVSLENFLY